MIINPGLQSRTVILVTSNKKMLECINRVFGLILAILVINRVWFLHSSLDLGTFLGRSHFFIIIKKKINKSPSQIMFTVI